MRSSHRLELIFLPKISCQRSRYVADETLNDVNNFTIFHLRGRKIEIKGNTMVEAHCYLHHCIAFDLKGKAHCICLGDLNLRAKRRMSCQTTYVDHQRDLQLILGS